MEREEIQRIIPHRDPFLFLDRVIDLQPGKSAVAEKYLSEDEPFFKGHFPGLPVMPGVLMIEALAQTGAVALLSLQENAGKIALFAGVDDFRFRKQVKPGDTLRLEVEITKSRGRIGFGKGKALVDGTVACEGTLMFALS